MIKLVAQALFKAQALAVQGLERGDKESKWHNDTVMGATDTV
jgi:hypothetical protein